MCEEGIFLLTLIVFLTLMNLILTLATGVDEIHTIHLVGPSLKGLQLKN